MTDVYPFPVWLSCINCPNMLQLAQRGAFYWQCRIRWRTTSTSSNPGLPLIGSPRPTQLYLCRQGVKSSIPAEKRLKNLRHPLWSGTTVTRESTRMSPELLLGLKETVAARSIQPKFPEISVYDWMDLFVPTGKISEKSVYHLRWTTLLGWTGSIEMDCSIWPFRPILNPSTSLFGILHVQYGEKHFLYIITFMDC